MRRLSRFRELLETYNQHQKYFSISQTFSQMLSRKISSKIKKIIKAITFNIFNKSLFMKKDLMNLTLERKILLQDQTYYYIRK